MRRSAPVVSVFCALVFVGATALAQQTFGPRTYQRSGGKPSVFQESFAADVTQNCNGRAVFVLRVQNGDGQGNGRVSSATVALNGATLFSESDLNQTVAVLEQAVALLSQNTLRIELKSAGQLTVTVAKEFEEPVGDEKTFVFTAKQQTFTFLVVAGGAADGVLTVRNGDGAGLHLVDGGSIRLNGVEVISTTELMQGRTIRKPVNLQASNVIVADLRGDVADTLRIALKRLVDERICGEAPRLTVITPAQGAALSDATILLTGTVAGPQGTGVSVDRYAAEIDLAHVGTDADPWPWFAEVPAPAAGGAATLTATATTPDGVHATVARAIVSVVPAESLLLRTNPPSGPAPLRTDLTVQAASRSAVVRCDYDRDGDGVSDATATSTPYRARLDFNDSGLYPVSVRCTLSDGRTLTAHTLILVQSFGTIDGLLRSVWSRFTDALAQQDVDAALRVMGANEREKYGPALVGVRALLPQYVGSMRGFDSVWIERGAAHYLLRRDLNGKTYGYHIYFARDVEGVWRLVQF